jgi:biopolymer transport protein TolR
MGMSMAAGRKGGRRRRGVPRYGAMADINMTPFIDIMLVLLIIFMVAAPCWPPASPSICRRPKPGR